MTPLGNEEALLEMIERTCFRKGKVADALAMGGIPASKVFGKNSFDYLIQLKGMSNLHSDERATPGLALNIAICSKGSDHLRSRPAIDLYHLPKKVLRKIYSNPVPYDELCRRGAPDVVGRIIDREKFAIMIDEFYEHKGLDKKGKPKAKTLNRLELANEPSRMSGIGHLPK